MDDSRLVPAQANGQATPGWAGGASAGAECRSRRWPAECAPQEQGHPSSTRQARRLWMGAGAVLCPVAAIGATLSFRSLFEASRPIFGRLAVGFPLLVDMLILGSTLAFLAGAASGHARPGWRWTAHGGAAGTLALNAMTAPSPTVIPWHVTPALVWSVLVEMSARQVTGGWQTHHAPQTGAIPARLWVSNPLQTTRVWLHMARRGERSHRQARADLAVQAAVLHALKAVMPGRGRRAARRLLRRQLRAGALDPTVILAFLHDPDGPPTADQAAAAVAALAAQPSGPPRSRAMGPVSPSAHERRSRAASAADRLARMSRPGAQPSSRAGALPGAARPGIPSDSQRQRRQAALQVLRMRPDIRAPQLAQELADRGWDVALRTAQRDLFHASEERARELAMSEQAGTEP